MDRNSIIGIVLIFVILVTFSIVSQPSKEEIAKAKQYKDSIAKVEEAKKLSEKQLVESQANLTHTDNVPDSVKQKNELQSKIDQFGLFGNKTVGEQLFSTLENNLIKLTFSNKGGRIYSVELKNFKTYDKKPLILFDGPETKFGLNFFAQNRSIQTDNFFFDLKGVNKNVFVNGPAVKKGSEGKIRFNESNPGGKESVVYTLEVEPGKYIEYVYTLAYNSYVVDFKVNVQGLNQIIASNQSELKFVWEYEMPRQEKISRFGEDRYANTIYKYFEGDLEKLKQSKSDEKNLPTKTKWIGMRQLFFNSTLIAGESFPNAFVKKTIYKDNPVYLGDFYTDISIPYQPVEKNSSSMSFYFGPNHYQTLKQFKIGLEDQVDLGYAIVRPVNKWLIIPVFNFLNKYIGNYGIIILLLTIFIKLILSPFTWKSYMSQAKMRVLKPEVDELNAKYGNDKPMEKQQATMALYKKAGVNPMGGCLPMLLQFPILIAMFFFFPTSIELRQQSFLWAHDLSTYDSIVEWSANIPFISSTYGNHVSLFCLLMTVTTIISTYMSQQGAASTQTMPGMKTMMYLMPIMFLFILNSYSAGLSYYYFLANVITILQTYLMRYFVNEDKIRAQIMLNKKKPVTKSNFQKKLEEMAKQRSMPRK